MSDNKALSIEDVQAILMALRQCSAKASTPRTVAKSLNLPGITQVEVEQVIGALDQLSYAKVPRSPSGRVAGLRFIRQAPGVCGAVFTRISPGFVQYFIDGVRAHVVEEGDYDKQKTTLAATIKHANDHAMPFFGEEYLDHAQQAAPFVWQALQKIAKPS